MIKLTKINSKNKSDISLVIIPGGPGLGSSTLRMLDLLSENYNLCYVDFPGTNNNPYKKDLTFFELANGISREVQNIPGRKVFIGHSFGGIFAAQCFSESTDSGLICIATPFLETTFSGLGNNYVKYITTDGVRREQEWNANKNDHTFKHWLASYGKLFFVDESGKELILSDQVSAKFFINNRNDAKYAEDILFKCSLKKESKLFVAGASDFLVSINLLQVDAEKGNFEFKIVQDAGHFPFYEKLKETVSIITKFIDHNYR